MILNKYQVEQKYIDIRHNTRSGAKLVSGTPVFFVAHDTGDKNATATNEWNYFNNLTDRSASAHVFIDDQHILEFIPTGLFNDPAEKAWHVIYDVPTDNEKYGDDANDVAIGVELCWGDTIDFKEAYARYVWYFGLLCTKFNKDPKQYIIGHQHLDPLRKIDPSNALNRYGVTYEQFINDVVSVMQEVNEEDDPVLKDQVAQLQTQVTALQQQIKDLQDLNSQPVPVWAKEANDIVTAQANITDKVGSYDFYRIIEILRRLGIIKK